MNSLITKIIDNINKITKERNLPKKDLYIKPIILQVLERNSFDVFFINFNEKVIKRTNKTVDKIENKFLKKMEKYDIDFLAFSDKGFLWGEFMHEIIPTKKNGKQIMLSFKGRNNIKKYYGKINFEKYVKMFIGNCFIDSKDAFKKIEKRFLDGLFNLSSIPAFYIEINNKLYFANKKEYLIYLANISGQEIKIDNIKMTGIMKKDKLKKIFFDYYTQLYGKSAWKRINVQGSFLNAYSNMKDISNMIEGPNDIMQEWQRKLGIAYDDTYIKRIDTDDIISDKNLEGFFLYYKNIGNTFKIYQELTKILLNNKKG